MARLYGGQMRSEEAIERRRAYQRNRMAQKSKAEISDHNNANYENRKARAIENLGGCCTQCSSTEELELDHVQPIPGVARSQAAEWAKAVQGDLDNLQLLCRSCHRTKTNQETKTRRR